MATAQQKIEWIKDQIDAGRTVYLSTSIRRTKITRKHIEMVRVRGNALEVCCGGKWLDYSYTQISAQ